MWAVEAFTRKSGTRWIKDANPQKKPLALHSKSVQRDLEQVLFLLLYLSSSRHHIFMFLLLKGFVMWFLNKIDLHGVIFILFVIFLNWTQKFINFLIMQLLLDYAEVGNSQWLLTTMLYFLSTLHVISMCVVNSGVHSHEWPLSGHTELIAVRREARTEPQGGSWAFTQTWQKLIHSQLSKASRLPER